MRPIGSFRLKHQNRAAVYFNVYLEVNNLVATTTYYKKNVYTTWTHPRSKLPHQIGHMITQKNNFCDAGGTVPLVDSDHQAVMCKLRISVHHEDNIDRAKSFLNLITTISTVRTPKLCFSILY